MRIYADPGLRPAWTVTRARTRELAATVIVKGTFDLVRDAAATPAADALVPGGDVPEGDEAPGAIRYEADFAPWKPRVDVLLVGTCHAPGGTAATAVPVTFRCGTLSKTLVVLGPRRWKRNLLLGASYSDPEPFTSLPLGWGRAFGGPGWAKNPAGHGREDDVLPNVEWRDRLVRSPKDKLDPAGFGPLARTWEQRAGLAGTYDAAWQKQHFPWFPADFDWGYFNAAPPDQQLASVAGDEDIELVHLRPDADVFRARLPGVRARAFVEGPLPGRLVFREVPLVLDTVWIDAAALRLVLVWRGLTPVASFRLGGIDKLLVVTAPLAEPVLDSSEYAAVLEARVRAGAGEDAEPEDVEDDAAGDAAFDADMAALDADMAALDAGTAAAGETLRAQLLAEDVPAQLLDAPAPAGTHADAVAALAQALAATRGEYPEAAGSIPDPPDVPDPDAELAEAPFEEEPEPEPWTRERVHAAVQSGTSLAEQDLAGLDLSGLDLAGAVLREAELGGAQFDGASLAGADLTGALLDGVSAASASFEGADLSGASCANAVLRGARLAGARLERTDLSGADLAGADLSRCGGRGTAFDGATLAQAVLRGAQLPAADFGGAILDDADFGGAVLAGANFEAASGARVILAQADLGGLHAGAGVVLRGADLRGVSAANSTWEGAQLEDADFSGAVLARADFSGCALARARFHRVDLSGATFSDAKLEDAILGESNLLRCNFERADLSRANLVSSNLYQAELWDTVLDGAVLAGANLKGTKRADR